MSGSMARTLGRVTLLLLAVASATPALADETPAVERQAVSPTEAKTRTERWLDMDPPAVIDYGQDGWERRGRASIPCTKPCPRPCPPKKQSRCCDYADWDRSGWGGSLALGMWLPGMKGHLGAGPVDLDVDVTAGDLLANLGPFLEKLEFMVQGAASVEYGRWGLDFIVSAIEFGDAIPLTCTGTNLEADASAKILQGQLNLRYRLGKSKLGCGPCPQLLVYEPYVGVRGYRAIIKVDLARGLGPDLGSTWFDPVVGGRITWDMRNRFALIAEGDVGGFGVGSELSWKLRLALSWRFARRWHLNLGWVWLGTDYESGTGLDRFRWDLVQSGPLLAVAFRF